MAKTLDNTNLGYLKSKMDDTYWPKADVLEIEIDEVPVADSTSLVESGGVYSFVKPMSQSIIPLGGLEPGVLYNLGVLTESTTIDLATPADATVANEYAFTFATGSTVPSIAWPVSLLGWAGNCLDSNGVPELMASKFYEVSILNGIGAIMEVEV